MSESCIWARNCVSQTWLLGSDEKRVHYFHEMIHVETGQRSAAQELMALHIDMRIRRVTPFPEQQREALARCRRQNTRQLCRQREPDVALPYADMIGLEV